MQKMIYACVWAPEREKSWSGTHLGLYNALNNYFELVDFDLNATFKDKIYNLLAKFDMSIKKNKFDSKKFSAAFADNNYPIFQFSESPAVKNSKSFVYQDLSVSSLKDISDNSPELFKVSGFGRFSKNVLNKREKIQTDFYFSDNCVGIFTMGKWLARYLVENGKAPKEKVFHVGGGINVDPKLIDYSQKKGNKILFIGRDFERKNGPLVVEAFKLLYQENSNFELFLAGPQSLDISHPNIHVLGDVGYRDLVKYFNICDVFCMPSKFEAYGLVFPEALIFGLPCIGRNAFEMPYFIEEGVTGELLRTESAEELKRLMQATLSNAQMANTVRERRDIYLNEYTWDSVAKRIKGVIEEVYGAD